MPEEVKEARKAVTEKKLAPPAYPGPPGLQPGPNLVSAAPPTVPAASQPPPASVPSAPSLPPPASMPGAGAPLAPPPPLCMGPGGMPPMMPPPPFGMPPGMMAPLPPPPMGYPGMPPMPGPMPGMPPMGMEPKEEEPVKYATREEARQAFKQMLTDCNVDPKATWESAMRSIVTGERSQLALLCKHPGIHPTRLPSPACSHDGPFPSRYAMPRTLLAPLRPSAMPPSSLLLLASLADRRYVALTTVKEKKTAFGEWRVQRERELKEEKKAARQRALDAFKEMLEERRFDLRGCRTLGEVAGKLGGEERWKRVETDRDRGEVFAQWAQEREKKDAEERREAFRARVAGEARRGGGGGEDGEREGREMGVVGGVGMETSYTPECSPLRSRVVGSTTTAVSPRHAGFSTIAADATEAS